jgi:hypothetical protein
MAEDEGEGDEEDSVEVAVDVWRSMLEAAQTGSLANSPGVREAQRRFYLQWLENEGLLTCPYCDVTFSTPAELAEHDKWECVDE